MGQRWVVSDGTNAQQVSAARIAIGGVVKDIPAALVSHEGFARKFFPTVADATDPRIVWDNVGITVNESVIDPVDSYATIDFNRDLGTYTYDDHPNADVTDYYLNPPVTAIEQYWIQIDQLTGIPLTGLPAYDPGMMSFGGSDYYSMAALPTSGNKFTMVFKFNVASFSGGSDYRIGNVQATTPVTRDRPVIWIGANDHATAEWQDRLIIYVTDTAGTAVCWLRSNIDVADGADHVCFISYDGDTGVSTFAIDGVLADDLTFTTRALTTGTLSTGTGEALVAASAGGTNPLTGEIGFFGYSISYLTNYSDFMDGNSPKQIDEGGWTEWGSQPELWNKYAQMTDNDGWAGNMTAVGTPTGPGTGTSPDGWIDLYSAANHVISLDQTAVGVLGATANIRIAPDDGAGNPDTTEQKTKSVTFASEVTGGAKIAWSDITRALVEETESVDADCDLIFNPDGSCVGSADTSGAFNENWHSDAPSPAAPGDFTVNATLVSGTAPTGSALATNLTLDTVRQWTLLATSGEDLTCALDITVSDGVDSITKRVTMNSTRSGDASDNTWTTAQWFLIDPDTSAPVATLNINADGSADGTIDSPPQTEETENWNSASPAAPDPEDYEVFLHNVSGLAGLITGSAIETWIPLSVNRSWSVTITSGLYREWVWDISIRRVGRVAVTKRVFVDLGTEGTE